MGALTEAEISDCLRTNFKLAAELSDDLARLPLKGVTYDRFRKTLSLIEGSCKQAAVWREDSRWLEYGLMMAKCHKLAGDWLRGIKLDDGTTRNINPGELHPLFAKLADNLRMFAALAERTRTAATGKMGMILPAALPAPHRDTRPVQVLLPQLNVSKGGIILPPGAEAPVSQAA